LRPKHFTILIVPHDKSKVKRFRVPQALLATAVGLAASAIVLLGVGFYTSLVDHIRLEKMQNERSRLEARNDAQLGQIKLFATRIRDMETRLEQMQALGRKLRAMANLNEQREVATPSPHFSIGGTSLGDERWAFSLYNLETALTDEMRGELDRLSLEASLQEQSLKELNQSFLEKSVREAHIPSIWPTRGLITSGFGERVNPITHRYQFHTGIDVAARRGTAVYATADGMVVFAGRSGGMGRMVVISHGKGLKTRYGHLSETYVAVGQRVTRGTKIGAIGSSGFTTGPHVHYEVVKQGVAINPRKYIHD
jgi:murein DD-endopeptidase MepM/ murein hydrolase activator NlpD